jgi:hypothetical protein
MRSRPQNRRAAASIVVLAILGILTLYILANLRTLHRLTADLNRIEKRQLRHWQPSKAGITITNFSVSEPKTPTGS